MDALDHRTNQRSEAIMTPRLRAPAGDPEAAGAEHAAPGGAAVRPLRLDPTPLPHPSPNRITSRNSDPCLST